MKSAPVDWAKCPQHPKYKVLRRPRSKCRVCETLWKLRLFSTMLVSNQ